MQITDKLIQLASGVGHPAFDKTAGAELVFEPLDEALAVSLYRSSWMARAIVDEPAHDMTRAWRSWQGDAAMVSKLERAEQALRLQAKVHNAVQLARLTGRAAIYVGTEAGPGDEPSQPLSNMIRPGAIRYLHVFKGSDLRGEDREQDLGHPNFGGYRAYAFHGSPAYNRQKGPKSQSGQIDQTTSPVLIHHSRLIWFRGATDPLDLTGGQSVLQSCYQPILDAEVLLAHVKALIGEAKLDVIKVRDLASLLSTEAGITRLQKRYTEGMALKSILGVTLIDSGSEEWERKQMNFAHLPELVQQRLDLVAAAARMPVTRLLGQSLGGLNATGESDIRNYYDMISGRQETGLRAALRALDRLLLAHADMTEDAMDYVWNPLYQLDEVSAADAALKRAQAAAL